MSGTPPQQSGSKAKWYVGLALAGGLGLGYIFGSAAATPDVPKPGEISYSEMVQYAQDKRIDTLTVYSTQGVAKGMLQDGRTFVVQVPSFDPKMYDILRDSNARVNVNSAPAAGSVFMSFLPMLIMIAFVGGLIFLKRRSMPGGGGMPGGLSKTNNEEIKVSDVRFADVAGVDEAKEDLKEMVDFLKDPESFSRLGGRIPRGAVLEGPPGTGKTLLARAVAGEAGVPFFSTSGSRFVEMYVGVGAKRVRDLFDKAKKNAPCVIFIDEIDAIGRKRGTGMNGGNDEREQTLNEILAQMDGFEGNSGVIVLAATNRVDILDDALMRPGRFDRKVTVGRPDLEGRERILAVHTRKVPLAGDVDLKTVARATPGFAGADLENLVNEAALLATRRKRENVTFQDFEDAKDKILMGAERRTLLMTDDEKKLTAYHEAGHALLALMKPASDPIHKATIMPRGGALGMVMRLPEGDRVSMSREKLLADLSIAAAGRAAEEIIFGNDKVTSGASSDIKYVTQYAYAAVTQWGLSEKLGFMRYVYGQDPDGAHQSMAPETARMVDQEVNRFATEALVDARKVINDNIGALHDIANALLEYETLTGQELRDIADGKKLQREKPAPKALPAPAEKSPVKKKPEGPEPA